MSISDFPGESNELSILQLGDHSLISLLALSPGTASASSQSTIRSPKYKAVLHSTTQDELTRFIEREEKPHNAPRIRPSGQDSGTLKRRVNVMSKVRSLTKCTAQGRHKESVSNLGIQGRLPQNSNSAQLRLNETQAVNRRTALRAPIQIPSVTRIVQLKRRMQLAKGKTQLPMMNIELNQTTTINRDLSISISNSAKLKRTWFSMYSMLDTQSKDRYRINQSSSINIKQITRSVKLVHPLLKNMIS